MVLAVKNPVTFRDMKLAGWLEKWESSIWPKTKGYDGYGEKLDLWMMLVHWIIQ